MDCREGEPDRSGSAASFEGFFDFETGDPRRPGYGIPRLRIVRPGPASPAPGVGAPVSEAAGRTAEPISTERVWGFEVWWRPDPTRAGLTEADREELEASKKLLRTLVRDARRRTPLAVR